MKPDLLVQNLYNTALIIPMFVKTEINRLCIVSGYATSAMASKHLTDFAEKDKFPKIDLIYGMAKTDGILQSVHDGFKKLTSSNNGDFTCSYLSEGEAVHAKIYIWCEDTKPVLAYTGSANYTETAFLRSQRREVLTETNPKRAYDYYKSLKGDSLNCLDDIVQNKFKISIRTNRPNFSEIITPKNKNFPVELIQDKKSQFYGLEKATVSLVAKNGQVPLRSNLNWGQRPEYNRDRNQSYLALRGDLRKSNFFPARGFHFTVLTDDNQIIQCVRAQDGDKAIHTPDDNAQLGRYFRSRLGLSSGALVTTSDLQRYGRVTVDFYKIDDENFYMDFSRS